jgi:hypothetical protein
MTTPTQAPMRAYLVTLKRRGEIVNRFEAMGRDSCSVVMQHIELAQHGEKLEVCSLWGDIPGTEGRAGL